MPCPATAKWCGAWTREVHKFQAMILSAANGGCMCDTHRGQVTGDLPTAASAMQLLMEVRTRPSRFLSAEDKATLKADLEAAAESQGGMYAP